MKQHNQIGKYIRKDELLNAKVGRTFVTPKNNQYTFNYRKEGRKYIFIIGYKEYNFEIVECAYNLLEVDNLIESVKN